ncbi:MAG: hypothetical protein BWY05_01153 [Euryarchaeota archaeon ADurb.Bin165]|nr:MAG: hypothetical protein BWY05_01153 [Euryarchaeota archaeon ADurb.Bin165]
MICCPDEQDLVSNQAYAIDIFKQRINSPLHGTMIIPDPALGKEIEFINEENAWRQQAYYIEYTVNIL